MKEKELEEHKLMCARTKIALINEDYDQAPEGDKFLKLRLEGDPVNTPLSEKSDRLRKHLRACDYFMVYIYTFNKETLRLLQIMRKEFADKFYPVVQFNFGDQFDVENFAMLQGVMNNWADEYFNDKKFNIVLKFGQELKKVISFFPKIDDLYCEEDHLQDPSLEEEEKMANIEKLSVKLKTADKYAQQRAAERGVKSFPETIR